MKTIDFKFIDKEREDKVVCNLMIKYSYYDVLRITKKDILDFSFTYDENELLVKSGFIRIKNEKIRKKLKENSNKTTNNEKSNIHALLLHKIAIFNGEQKITLKVPCDFLEMLKDDDIDTDYSNCASISFNGYQTCTIKVGETALTYKRDDNNFNKFIMGSNNIFTNDGNELEVESYDILNFLNAKEKVVYKMFLRLKQCSCKVKNITLYGIASKDLSYHFSGQEAHIFITQLSTNEIYVSITSKDCDYSSDFLCSEIYTENEYLSVFGECGKEIDDSNYLYLNRRIDFLYKQGDNEEGYVDLIEIDTTKKCYELYLGVDRLCTDGYTPYREEIDSQFISDEIFDVILEGLKKLKYKKGKIW